MRLISTILVTLLWLSSVTVSFGQKLSLPLHIGKNADLGITEYVLFMGSYEAEFLVVLKKYSYTQTRGGFQDFIRNELRALVLDPPPEAENTDYVLSIQTDGAPSFDSEGSGGIGSFKLEKTPTGWKLPDSILNLELEYSGGWGAYLPTTTGLTAESTDGKIFSTLGRGRNDFGSACSLEAIWSGFQSDQIIGFPNLIGSKAYPLKRFTVFEGDLSVSFNADGEATSWSSPAPSFFDSPRDPSPIVFRKAINGQLEITVTGNGYLEEAETLDGSWGVPYSLSSIRPQSDGVRTFLIKPIGAMRFYRLRQEVAVQKQ